MSLAERREAGEVVARNARMLLNHVNDLLDMSGIEAKKLTIDLVDMDVAALVRFVTSHCSVLAVERNIQVEVGCEEGVRRRRGSREVAARADEPRWQPVQLHSEQPVDTSTLERALNSAYGDGGHLS